MSVGGVLNFRGDDLIGKGMNLIVEA